MGFPGDVVANRLGAGLAGRSGTGLVGRPSTGLAGRPGTGLAGRMGGALTGRGVSNEMTRLGFSLASSAVGSLGRGALEGGGNLGVDGRDEAAYPVVLVP